MHPISDPDLLPPDHLPSGTRSMNSGPSRKTTPKQVTFQRAGSGSRKPCISRSLSSCQGSKNVRLRFWVGRGISHTCSQGQGELKTPGIVNVIDWLIDYPGIANGVAEGTGWKAWGHLVGLGEPVIQGGSHAEQEELGLCNPLPFPFCTEAHPWLVETLGRWDTPPWRWFFLDQQEYRYLAR